jgi:hypothetical protein
MAIKINPADVVSIPADYDNTKGRCCRYVVASELGEGDSFEKLEDKAVFGAEPKPVNKVGENFKDPYKKAAKYKGVTWDKAAGKFKAQLPFKPDTGSRHIGYFNSAKKAYKAVKKALKKAS